MDTKTVVISMLLAAIMAGSGAVIYTTSNAVEEQNNPPEKVEPEIQIENNAPKILMDTDLSTSGRGRKYRFKASCTTRTLFQHSST